MIILFLIAGTMLVMCIVDLEEYFIPNSTQYFLAILATALVLVDGGIPLVLINLKEAFLYVIFGVALYAFFYYAANIEALGIDDIKFFFIAGFMLGSKGFVGFMLLSGIFGLLFGSIWKKVKKEETFPFAPAICLATFLCLLFNKHFNPVDLLGSMLFF
jgi:prepilin signal peptidase PulO-like enzyme (type II secretory pathway)